MQASHPGWRYVPGPPLDWTVPAGICEKMTAPPAPAERTSGPARAWAEGDMAEASDRDLGVQNEFFNQARKARSRITILVNSGKRLGGRSKAFERYISILSASGGAGEAGC